MEALIGPERQAVVERLARLLSAVGSGFGDRPLVLPNGDFFPDRFSGDEASVVRLVGRMQAHAGMSDIPLTTRLVESESEHASAGGCGTGSCHVPSGRTAGRPRLVDEGDGWLLNVPAEEVSNPVVLTAMTARALGHVFLAETLPDGAALEDPPELLADHAAAGLGLGPLLLEGAYIYSKGCGGPQVAQVTAAGLPELSLVVALLAEARKQPLRRVFAELGTTQTALLRESHAWVRESPGLVRALREAPELVLTGGYVAIPAQTPFWKRWFSGAGTPERPAPSRPRASRPPDDLRQLVDEVLTEARAREG